MPPRLAAVHTWAFAIGNGTLSGDIAQRYAGYDLVVVDGQEVTKRQVATLHARRRARPRLPRRRDDRAVPAVVPAREAVPARLLEAVGRVVRERRRARLPEAPSRRRGVVRAEGARRPVPRQHRHDRDASEAGAGDAAPRGGAGAARPRPRRIPLRAERSRRRRPDPPLPRRLEPRGRRHRPERGARPARDARARPPDARDRLRQERDLARRPARHPDRLPGRRAAVRLEPRADADPAAASRTAEARFTQGLHGCRCALHTRPETRPDPRLGNERARHL